MERECERITRHSWRLERPLKAERLDWHLATERYRVVTPCNPMGSERFCTKASLNTSWWQVSELTNCRNTERTESRQHLARERQPLEWKRAKESACFADRDNRDLSRRREPCCDARNPRRRCDAKSASPTSCRECSKHCLAITLLVTVEESDTTCLEPNTGSLLVQLDSRSKWSEHLSKRDAW